MNTSHRDVEALKSKCLKSNNGPPTHRMCDLGPPVAPVSLSSVIYKMGAAIKLLPRAVTRISKVMPKKLLNKCSVTDFLVFIFLTVMPSNVQGVGRCLDVGLEPGR